jgi:hypothetical protein
LICEESANNYIHEEENSMEDNGINLNKENIEKPKSNKFFDVLKSSTGDGSIDDYMEHPLNTKSESSIAQIIRGLTGLLGSLDLAIIDIVLGIIVFVKERSTNV